MSEALRTLFESGPRDEPAPAVWVEPDLVIVDDLHGPAALRLLVEHFGAHAPLARPDRVHVVSGIDLESALPDRVAAHEALQAFAAQHGLIFTHQIGGCDDGCAPLAPAGREWLIATTRKADAAAAARGCVSVLVQPMDVAALLAKGRTWACRPPVQQIIIEGDLPPGAAVHDLAITLRPLIRRGVWACLDWPQHRDDSSLCALCALLLGDSPAQNITVMHGIDDLNATRVNASDLSPVIGEDESVHALGSFEPTDVDRVYIGSCTTGSVADLRLAAEVLAGQRVHVPTVIAPASMRDVQLLKQVRLGDDGPDLETVFREAGCDLGLPGCAACVNAIGDVSQPQQAGERLTVVATAVANVSTRRAARVLTASPITAANIALHGRIGGPRLRTPRLAVDA